MGVLLEIYSCKKSDLYGAQLDAPGYDFDIVSELPQTRFYYTKGDYANARVIHAALDGLDDFSKLTGHYTHDLTVLCKSLTRNQLELIDSVLTTKGHDEDSLKFHQAIKTILEKVDFETEEVLFDFA